MVQHAISRRAHTCLQPHLDEFFTIQLLKDLFGERPWQTHALGDGRRGWLRQHCHVLEREVT
jgi:hypothetical protein